MSRPDAAATFTAASGICLDPSVRRKSTIVTFVAVATLSSLISPTQEASADCSPASGFQYVCGQTRPEDLVRIPDTRWIIASGFSDGAGLKLVDTSIKTLTTPFSGASIEVQPDRVRFPDCADPPDLQLLNMQGLNLRAAGKGRFTLYAINHGGRESVEIFDVDANPDLPAFTWQGCLLLPTDLAANSVTTYSDGTILVTVLVHPGNTYADFVEGRNTGGVYEWQPGSSGFELVPGTRLPGNNGIEAAADDSGFFVVAFGRRAILRYSRNNSSSVPIESVAPGFMPDNIHWDQGRLITAGMVYDEPACGGKRKIIDGVADGMKCHRGSVVAELDPSTMTFRTIAYVSPDPDFNGASAAVLVGQELWIGSYQSDCLAYRALP